VFPRRLLESDDFVKVHEAALPLKSAENRVDGPLENRRGIGQTEEKANVTIGPLMANDGRFVPVLVLHGDLSIPQVADERQEHVGVPEEVNTIFHTGQRIHVPHLYLVELAGIHAEPHRPFGFRVLKCSGHRGWGTTVKWLSGLTLFMCVRTCFVGCPQVPRLSQPRAPLK